MRQIFKFILMACALICFALAFQSCDTDKSASVIRNDIDTLPFIGLGEPLELRTQPGIDWRFWRLSDSTFAMMSMDSSNSLQSIVREDSLFAWFMTKLPDSLNLASYNDTLRVSNDTMYISGQATGFYIGGGSSNQSATFIIAPTGTTADYNTDGTADEVQIEAAIAALPAEGGSILLREGNYTVSNVSIPYDKKITIAGVGGGTVINVPNGDTAFYATNSAWVGYGNQEDLVIKDMRIEGSTDDATGIYLHKRHISTIQNIVFVGDSITAIELNQTNNVKILNNFFNRVQRGIIGVANLVSGDDVEDITISGNDFSYVGREAIRLVSTSLTNQQYISKINIVGNNIEESDFDRLGRYAIYLGYCQGATILGNSISQTYRGGGIYLSNSRMNVISNNHFAQNGINQLGGDTPSTILLVSSDKNLITANTITNETVDYGVNIFSGTNNRVAHNWVDLAEANRYLDSGTSNIFIKSETGVLQFDLGTTDGFELQYDKSSSSGAFFISRSGGSSNAGFIGYAHGGTTENPTVTEVNKYLALLSGRGYDGTAFSTGAKGYLGVRTSHAWNASSNPSEIVFATTPVGSTTVSARMLIANDGKVAIGPSDPTTSAKLDIQGTDGAVLLPRLTTTQRNALTGTNGMIIYNTTDNQIQGYENGSWVDL